uniref:Uncharacterized protein n=1 Tax=Cacopsylla melanoneura TaxID=428564 RepID=A0A8D9EPX9_9HEMI
MKIIYQTHNVIIIVSNTTLTSMGIRTVDISVLILSPNFLTKTKNDKIAPFSKFYPVSSNFHPRKCIILKWDNYVCNLLRPDKLKYLSRQWVSPGRKEPAQNIQNLGLKFLPH